MKILAVDTATQICGIAVTSNHGLVAEYRLNQKNVHNEKLVGAIQDVMADCGCELGQLDGLAVSVGPGSFTGLRIGLAVCKGLAFTLDLPLVAVNTLDALAFQASPWPGQICALLKAREGEVYFALYEKKRGQLQRCSDYQIVTVSEVSRRLDQKTLLVAYPPDLMPDFLQDNITQASADVAYLRPSTIALMGEARLREHATADIASLEPFYLKEFKPKKKAYYGESVR
ncbi:MAG: tRNA (adenosine(37)-N6)-threonylcarbamoyltransferase complex dimerization subunit type 1 TsaB [bacterium]